MDWDKVYRTSKKFIKPLNELLLNKLLQKAEEVLEREPENMLDLGCGTGGAVIKFAKRGIKATGVDFSEEALKIAREASKKAGVQDKTEFLNAI